MKTRISLLLFAVMAFVLPDLDAKDTASADSSTTKDKKITIVETNNPFAAQQKKIESVMSSLKASKRRNKKSIEEKLEREQDALKRLLNDTLAPLNKKAEDLQSRLTLYKEKGSSKAATVQKELEKVQAEIKRLQSLAAIDKWCKSSNTKADDGKKKSDSKKSSSKHKKYS